MRHLGLTILSFLLVGSFLSAGEIPHEKKEFVEKLSDSMQSLENDFINDDSQTSRAGKLLSSLLKSFLKEKVVKVDYVLASLDNFKELKDKLLKLKKAKHETDKADSKDENILIADLLEMLKDDFKGIEEKEKEGVKNQLIALLLSELKQKNSAGVAIKDKLQGVILDYLQAAKKLDPNKAVLLSEEFKKGLGIAEDAKSEDFLPENLIKRIKEKGIPSEKAGMDLLSNLVGNSLENVENLDNALEPVYKGLYNSLLEVTPNKMAIPEGGFNSAMGMINQFRTNPVPVPPSSSNDNINLTPIKGHGRLGSGGDSSGIAGGIPNEIAIPPTISRIFYNEEGGAIPGSGSGKIPSVIDDPKLKTCLDSVREKRFNVELKLPKALCASTPVSANPKAEMEGFLKKEAGEKCTVKLATAVHCLEGMSLNGSTIGTKIDGRSINATVLKTGSIDRNGGTPVENGNPDLAMIIASVPCSEAARLHIARVPTQSEVKDLLARDSLPVIMQQNSQINASMRGDNKATIAAQGSFETVNGGKTGNFLRFNSNSTFNGWLAGDSGRIRQGDSGGTALTCKMNDSDEILDYLYLGAISHIDVRGDDYEGTVGGVASGQSLLNLSKLLKAHSTDQTATQHASTDVGSAIGRQVALTDSASTHK